MLYLTTAWAFLASCVILVVLSSVSFVAGLIDSSGDSSHVIARWWGKGILLVSGIRVHVKGLEHIDPNKQYIFFSNHQSIYDIFVLLAFLPVQFRYIIKRELYKVPFLNLAMWAARYIPLDRGKSFSAMRSLKKAIEALKQGKSIMVFPEGTRSQTGEVGEFKRGSMLIASSTKKPVVPVSINGTFNIMPKGTRLLHHTDVYLTFFKPIEVSKLNKKEQKLLGEDVRSIIVKNIESEASPKQDG